MKKQAKSNTLRASYSAYIFNTHIYRLAWISPCGVRAGLGGWYVGWRRSFNEIASCRHSRGNGSRRNRLDQGNAAIALVHGCTYFLPQTQHQGKCLPRLVLVTPFLFTFSSSLNWYHTFLGIRCLPKMTKMKLKIETHTYVIKNTYVPIIKVFWRKIKRNKKYVF